MSIEKIVVNASPLITLAKTGHAALLPALFQTVFLPESVAFEIRQADDAASRLIVSADGIENVVVGVNPEIDNWNLGDGESSVLSYALAHKNVRASLDDRAARRCAEALSIRTIGTVGILVLAKRRGLIDSARIAINAVRDAGLYVSDELMDLVIREVEGE